MTIAQRTIPAINDDTSDARLKGEMGDIRVNFVLGSTESPSNRIVYRLNWAQTGEQLRRDIPEAITQRFLSGGRSVALVIDWKKANAAGLTNDALSQILLGSVDAVTERRMDKTPAAKWKPFRLTLLTDTSAKSSAHEQKAAYETLVNTFAITGGMKIQLG